jgi:hypothetical protein
MLVRLHQTQQKNLEIERAGGVTLSGDLTITGDYKLTSGNFDIASNTLSLSGTISRTSGGIDADNGTVDFVNVAQLSLPADLFATNVKNLKVSGAGGIVTNAVTKVTNALDMTGGNIAISAGTLEIGTDATTVGSINWQSGSVVGKMKRWFSTSSNFANNVSTDKASGIFPVGTSDFNRYAQINFTESTSGGYIEMEYIEGAPTVLDETLTPLEDPYNLPYFYSQGGSQFIQNADATGYWEIKPFSSAGEAYASLDDKEYNLTLRINNVAAFDNHPVTENPPGMRIIRAKGNPDGSHEPFGIANTIATITQLDLGGEDFSVKSNGLQGFSWFNIGGDNQTPLPIELISFTGFCGDNQTTINWKTASEFKSSYYIVEKSTDGQNWREVNNQAAAGFSTEELTYQFVDGSKNDDNAYYRLTQFDTDGEFTVYDPIFVSCNENGSFIKTYPNPSDASFQVLVNNPSLVGKATIQLVDTKGTVVSMKEVEVAEGTNLFYLNENMAPGIYYLSISNGTNSTEVIKHSVK